MKIGKGTNRIVILTRDKAIKIPTGILGYYANINEYNNYRRSKHKDRIANTKLKLGCVIQEKLHDVQIFDYKTSRHDMPDYAVDLLDIRVHNRLQIGRDIHGNYKIFDYEEVKYLVTLEECPDEVYPI